MSILGNIYTKRRFFDASNDEDISILKHFLTTSSWGDTACPFVLEHPYYNVLNMMTDKVLERFLSITIRK